MAALLCLLGTFADHHLIYVSMSLHSWKLSGTDAFGTIQNKMNPHLDFYENDTVTFKTRMSKAKDLSLANWAGTIDDFAAVTGRNKTTYKLRLGPTLHYFCESCGASTPYGDIAAHSHHSETVLIRK